MNANQLQLKYVNLLGTLSDTGGAVVAFSGGVDSTFLLYAAKQALKDKVIAISISTPYTPKWELKEAEEIASSMKVKHIIQKLPFPEELRNNPADHCYTCKKILFGKLKELAHVNSFPSVLDGTNIDDLSDYRPGLKALKELKILSPLVKAGLSKNEIRKLSKEFDLPTWDKPSFACLLSRMPIGISVSDEDLKRVEAAEVFLMQMGFPAVRVRNHGDLARIEVPENRVLELVKANKKHSIELKLKELGYRHVSVDISGYSMGSLNDKT